MKTSTIRLLLVLAVGTACAAAFQLTAGAQPEPKKDDPAAADQQTIKSEATKLPAASAVKFRKELNLPFATLTTLGSRIDAARRTGDPVALAHAAGELRVAEKVAGKTGSLTSRQVLAESIELAKIRRQEAELQAALEVAQKQFDAEQEVLSLQKQLTLTKELTAQDKAAITTHQEPTSSPRKVIVNNYTPQYVDVTINGYLKGQVLPGASAVFTVEHRWNPTVLKAYGNEDITVWGPIRLWGRFGTYTWNLN